MTNHLRKNSFIRPGQLPFSCGIVLAVLALIFMPAADAVAANKSATEDPIFAGADEFAHGATKTTEVNLGPDMLQMANGMSNGEMMKGMPPGMKNVNYIYVRKFEYAKPGQYKMADLQKFVKRLQGNGWKQMVQKTSSNYITGVYVRTDDHGESREMVVIKAEPTELKLVHLKGLDSTNEIGKTSSAAEPQLKNRPQK